MQRVPKTEKSGRLHTSTMTVAVLPQPSQVCVWKVSQSINQAVNQSINQSSPSYQHHDRGCPPSALPGVCLESQSVNQSINQSISQSISPHLHTLSPPRCVLGKSISQSVNQAISQSSHQSIKQSVSQSIKQSVSQSINQPINQSINQSSPSYQHHDCGCPPSALPGVC